MDSWKRNDGIDWTQPDSEIKKILKQNSYFGNADTHGYTMLMYAVFNRRTKIMEFIIEEGRKKNNLPEILERRDYDGNTALLLSAENNYLDEYKILEKNGAKTQIKNNDGYTASMLAKKNNPIGNVVIYLREKRNPIRISQKKLSVIHDDIYHQKT